MSDTTKLHEALMGLLNKHSAENGSNTADFILAEYLLGCLRAFDAAVNAREVWYDRAKVVEGEPLRVLLPLPEDAKFPWSDRTAQFGRGDRVWHPRYGVGTVGYIQHPDEPYAAVVVHFDQHPSNYGHAVKVGETVNRSRPQEGK